MHPFPLPNPKQKKKMPTWDPGLWLLLKEGVGDLFHGCFLFLGWGGGGLNVLLCNPEKDGIGVWIFNHHSLVVKELIS